MTPSEQTEYDELIREQKLMKASRVIVIMKPKLMKRLWQQMLPRPFLRCSDPTLNERGINNFRVGTSIFTSRHDATLDGYDILDLT